MMCQRYRRLTKIIQSLSGEYTAVILLAMYNQKHPPILKIRVGQFLAVMHRNGKIDRCKKSIYKTNKFGMNVQTNLN